MTQTFNFPRSEVLNWPEFDLKSGCGGPKETVWQLGVCRIVFLLLEGGNYRLARRFEPTPGEGLL